MLAHDLASGKRTTIEDCAQDASWQPSTSGEKQAELGRHIKAPPELRRELCSFERLQQASDESELLEFKNLELQIEQLERRSAGAELVLLHQDEPKFAAQNGRLQLSGSGRGVAEERRNWNEIEANRVSSSQFLEPKCCFLLPKARPKSLDQAK